MLAVRLSMLINARTRGDELINNDPYQRPAASDHRMNLDPFAIKGPYVFHHHRLVHIQVWKNRFLEGIASSPDLNNLG